MLHYKQAHGTGTDLEFPSAAEIDEVMKNHPRDQEIFVYGDGSHTTPLTWWAALGGICAWIPKWGGNGQPSTEHEEIDVVAAGIVAVADMREDVTDSPSSGWVAMWVSGRIRKSTSFSWLPSPG